MANSIHLIYGFLASTFTQTQTQPHINLHIHFFLSIIIIIIIQTKKNSKDNIGYNKKRDREVRSNEKKKDK